MHDFMTIYILLLLPLLILSGVLFVVVEDIRQNFELYEMVVIMIWKDNSIWISVIEN